ncbi:MAG: hypothetical protein JO081_07515 [Alphaproteobacteria bacterium]|nr:hypothetical protein [Alphaproteobacteria bacterium]
MLSDSINTNATSAAENSVGRPNFVALTRLCFHRATTRARAQQARLFELNAARDLALLSADADDSTEARERLRCVADWFPAALDVRVLAESRGLLPWTG